MNQLKVKDRTSTHFTMPLISNIFLTQFPKQIISDIEIASCIQKGIGGIEGRFGCNFTLLKSVKVK